MMALPYPEDRLLAAVERKRLQLSERELPRCEDCNQPFARDNEKRRYCSQSCKSRAAGRRQRHAEQDLRKRPQPPERKRPQLATRCRECEEPFEPPSARERYCSPQCVETASRRRTRERMRAMRERQREDREAQVAA
jgi:hypothetical protein